MRAVMMVAVVKSVFDQHSSLAKGHCLAAPMFHTQTRLATPVSPNRTVSYRDFVETYEIPTDDDCQLIPRHAKHRTHNPVCIDKDNCSPKETIQARESDAILAAQMLQSAISTANIASVTSDAKVISAVAIASDPT